MNHIFKIIWNKTLGRMVIASELAKQAVSQRTSTIKVTCKIDQFEPNHLKPQKLSALAIAIFLSGHAWAGSTCVLTPANSSSTAVGTIALSCGIGNYAVDNFGVAVGAVNSSIGKGSAAIGSSSAYDDFFFIRTPVTTKDSSGFVNSIDGVSVVTHVTDVFDLYSNPNNSLTFGGLEVSDPVKLAFLSAVFGGGNLGLGNGSSAIGVQNIASGNESSALGYANTALRFKSSAVGHINIASGVNSSAIGGYNTALGQTATAVGSGSGIGTPTITLTGAGGTIDSIDGITVTTIATSLAALDYSTLTAIQGNTTFDSAVKQSFVDAIKNGGNLALGDTSSALGTQNRAVGSNSAAVGDHNSAIGTGSSAVGQDNMALGDNSAAVGSSNTVQEASSNAFGRNNKITRAAGTAVGLNNTVSGLGGSALGLNNTASGDYGSAVGYGNTASAENSSAFGHASRATANNATAVGYDSLADEQNTVSVGRSGVEKRITNVAAATKNTDAVNFSQVQPLATAFGGGAGFSGGVFTAPTYVIQGTNHSNVRSAFDAVDSKLTSLDTRLTTVENNGGGAQGPQGPKGDKGDQGNTGLTGAKGDIGLTGAKGDKGDQGNTGLTGAKGDKGDQGNTGLTGAKGDKGDQGNTGLTGAKGDKGDQGNIGLTGAKGDKGDQGNIGLTGAKGDKGDQGNTGLTGAKGDLGNTGAAGLNGINGAKGDQGLSTFEIAVKNGFIGTEPEWLATQTNSYIAIQSNASQQATKPQATGQDAIAIGAGLAQGAQSVSIGKGNQVTGNHSGAIGDPNIVSGNGSYAVGNDNTVTGDNTVVLGNNVNTAAKNAIVLGNNSASDRDNTLSVGAVGKERQVIHVAAGTADTDAVNVKQVRDGNAATLTSARTYTDGKVNTLNDSFNNYRHETDYRFNQQDEKIEQIGAMSGALSGMAMNAAGLAGKNRVAVGVGSQGGQQAVAVGYQITPTSNISASLGAAFSGSNQTVSAGFGFSW